MDLYIHFNATKKSLEGIQYKLAREKHIWIEFSLRFRISSKIITWVKDVPRFQIAMQCSAEAAELSVTSQAVSNWNQLVMDISQSEWPYQRRTNPYRYNRMLVWNVFWLTDVSRSLIPQLLLSPWIYNSLTAKIFHGDGDGDAIRPRPWRNIFHGKSMELEDSAYDHCFLACIS